MDLLEPMNIEFRYPTHKEQLLKSLTKKRCVEILENVQELLEWIKMKLWRDASYLDLAMRKGLPIATQDRVLRRVAIECSVEIFLPMSPQGENP